VAQTLPPALASGEAMLAAKVDVAGGAQGLGTIRTDHVGAGFFETIGAPILRGRDFTARDEQAPTRVAIVSATMANRTWPNQDPIGRVIDLDGEAAEVIGVAGDLASAFPLAPTSPVVYRPLSAAGFARPSNAGVVVVARVRPGADAPSLLRREIASVDPSATVFGVTRVTDEIADARFLARFATMIYGGMGAFGLALASVGLAGVTAHAVARRRREIGIRMALGAGRGRVLWLVLRESSAIIVAGTAAGLVLALMVARVLAALLDALAAATRTSLTDPLIIGGGPILLALLALVACYLPARQSTRINPTTALRAE
jgi:putative ABC transport system permease protein